MPSLEYTKTFPDFRAALITYTTGWKYALISQSAVYSMGNLKLFIFMLLYLKSVSMHARTNTKFSIEY